ncbi:MAG: hypothetical protein ACXAB4_04760 [Candidatus Hodarchaeales archaeon]
MAQVAWASGGLRKTILAIVLLILLLRLPRAAVLPAKAVQYADIDYTITVKAAESSFPDSQYSTQEVIFRGEINPLNNLTIINITVLEKRSPIQLGFYLPVDWEHEGSGSQCILGEKDCLEFPSEQIVEPISELHFDFDVLLIEEGNQYDFAIEWHPCASYMGARYRPYFIELIAVPIESEVYRGAVLFQVHVATQGFVEPAIASQRATLDDEEGGNLFSFLSDLGPVAVVVICGLAAFAGGIALAHLLKHRRRTS